MGVVLQFLDLVSLTWFFWLNLTCKMFSCTFGLCHDTCIKNLCRCHCFVVYDKMGYIWTVTRTAEDSLLEQITEVSSSLVFMASLFRFVYIYQSMMYILGGSYTTSAASIPLFWNKSSTVLWLSSLDYWLCPRFIWHMAIVWVYGLVIIYAG